jgi:hypothetical protein
MVAMVVQAVAVAVLAQPMLAERVHKLEQAELVTDLQVVSVKQVFKMAVAVAVLEQLAVVVGAVTLALVAQV